MRRAKRFKTKYSLCTTSRKVVFYLFVALFCVFKNFVLWLLVFVLFVVFVCFGVFFPVKSFVFCLRYGSYWFLFVFSPILSVFLVVC